MNFEKIHQYLVQGQKIRRKAWEPFKHLCKDQHGIVKGFHGEEIAFYGTAALLLTYNWFVLGTEERKLSFVDALAELKRGKHIGYGESSDFLFVNKGELVLCRQMPYDFMPTFKDLCSDDWETMK